MRSVTWKSSQCVECWWRAQRAAVLITSQHSHHPPPTAPFTSPHSVIKHQSAIALSICKKRAVGLTMDKTQAMGDANQGQAEGTVWGEGWGVERRGGCVMAIRSDS